MGLNKLLKEINEYREKDKLSFFVGAGVSKLSEYPSWGELVLSMANDIGYTSYIIDKEGKPHLSSEEFLKIPQMYYTKKGATVYFNKVKGQLDVHREPNDIHKMIMKLNPYHILTTNYDNLLEQTANLFSINYSIINNDSKVANTPTQRYILKVHGDFENNNFVLKEHDYLDYSENYKLIDNVMKTLMATNLIIFIGYQLSDYNIKLILNWVQNVQKDSFVQPVFIYTEPEQLDENSINYYNERKLRIIRANELTDSSEYFDRYKVVLDKIINYKEEPKTLTKEGCVDYIYEKLLMLEEMTYIRADDFISLFNGYTIDKTNIINFKGELFSNFYELKKEQSGLSQKLINKIDYISKRIKNSGINGCHTKNNILFDFNHFEIINDTFNGNYTEIETRISEYSNSVEELYNKAYDLFSIGKFNDCYYLYVMLLDKSKSEKKWIYYYLVQINIRYLSQVINLVNSMTNGIKGIMYFGETLQLFDVKLLNDIELTQAFSDLPAEIKKYSFLSGLGTVNYYMPTITKLYDENYKIAMDASNKSVTIIGTSAYDHSELVMMDAVNFIYNNKILFSIFSEHKNFIKITMHSYLKGKMARMQIKPDVQHHIKKVTEELTCQDILLIIKNFKIDDIRYLENDEVNLKEFKLSDDETKKFEKYVLKTIGYYVKNFYGNIEGDKINMYIMIKEEFNSMCYLSHYFIKNKAVLYKLAHFILFYIPEKEMDLNKKIICICQLIEDNNNVLDKEIRNFIESFLIKKVLYCIEYPNSLSNNTWGQTLSMFAQVIHEYDRNFISEELSKICVKDLHANVKKFMFDCAVILTEDAINICKVE